MTSKRQRKEVAGRWLRRERERRGMRTTGALARRMGVSDSLISRIETGASAATDERAEQIADALGMDILEVRRNLGLWVPPNPTEIPKEADPVDRELARRIKADPQRLLRAILEAYGYVVTDDEEDDSAGDQAS